MELINQVQLEQFPKSYTSWDKDGVLQYEPLLNEILRGDLYKARIQSIQVPNNDQELKGETARPFVSLSLFNSAYLRPMLTETTAIVLVAAAFEALLNLPSEGIVSASTRGVAALLGGRTKLVKKWCTDFYEYRSKHVHGDNEWRHRIAAWKVDLGKGPHNLSHSVIAWRVFVRCLEAKLFLAGRFAQYDPTMFNFDEFIREQVELDSSNAKPT